MSDGARPCIICATPYCACTNQSMAFEALAREQATASQSTSPEPDPESGTAPE